MISGVRYILHSPSIRIVLARTLVTGIGGGSVAALLPLVARDLLHGGAQTYGIMLGAFGMGAVIGALNLSRLAGPLQRRSSGPPLRHRDGRGHRCRRPEQRPVLTGLRAAFRRRRLDGLGDAVQCGVQMSVPRWVAGRALAGYQAAIAGGIALGSWMWGNRGQHRRRGHAAHFGARRCSPLRCWALDTDAACRRRNDHPIDPIADPEVRLPLTPRSGPIVVELEYRVDPKQARLFYSLMQHVQHSRERNGAYGWSLARDIADPEIWTERFHCPTWLDYLRQRSRPTQSERLLQQRALEFQIGPEPVRIRRMLERPIGSVRWKEATPDRSGLEVEPIAAVTGGA